MLKHVFFEKKKLGLITLADFEEKVKNRHFSSAFFIKKIDSFSKKICKFFFFQFIIEAPQVIFENCIQEKVGKN